MADFADSPAVATLDVDVIPAASARLAPALPELRTEVFEQIEVFYNRQRRHSTLGQRSPVDHENSTLSPSKPIDAAQRLATPDQIKFTAPTAAQVA